MATWVHVLVVEVHFVGCGRFTLWLQSCEPKRVLLDGVKVIVNDTRGSSADGLHSVDVPASSGGSFEHVLILQLV